MSSARTRLFAIIIITVFSFIIVTGIGNFRAKQLAVNLTGDVVTQAVAAAAAGLDGEKVREIGKTMDEQDPFYAEICETLTDIKDTYNLEDISIIYKDEEKAQWFNIADTRKPGDPAHNILGEPEKSVSASVEKTIRGKTVQGEYRVTSQGALVTSYQEIKDSQGEAFAVLVGDFKAEEMTDFLYLTRYTQLGLIALTLLLIGGTFLFTKRNK